MSIVQRYKEIFSHEILERSKGVIFSFSPLADKWTYKPFSHDVSDSAVEQLAELMRLNLFFYTYGEEEVVDYYLKDRFSSMEQAAKYAYRNRLPKRAEIQDGLPSEALLDLLVQLYNPSAYKLAVRTILRQDDNNEIKGYDLTYFTRDDNGISLWLGQAKLGGKDYCKSGINDDLVKKFKSEYLSKQLFFVSDKRIALTPDAKAILEAIEEINILSMEDNDVERARKLLYHFRDNGISIKIPCLLAYGQETVYDEAAQLYGKVMAEAETIRDYFVKHTYQFEGFSPEIIFYIFPIESIERLRDKETGFYAGLR